MPPAVGVEDLLAVQGDLDRPLRAQRQEARRELVRERVALAAERAAVGRRDDPDPRAREAEHLLELAMQVVRDLGAGPERQVAVRLAVRDAAVRLDRCVGVALEEEPIVAGVVGLREARLEVAEAQVDLLEDVRAPAALMDLHVLADQRLLDGQDRFERLVLDVDERQRLERGVLIERCDGRDGLADVAHLVDRERRLVLGRRHDPHLLGHVLARDDGHHAGMGERAPDVELHDPGVGLGRPEQAPVKHARQDDVVGVLRLTRQVGPGVHLRQAPAQYRQVRRLGHPTAAAFSIAS